MSPGERAAVGKALRSEVPRSSHADWECATERPDPIALLEEQGKSRLPELLPIRRGRMAASPFAFYRGAACVMASDLAGTPSTGIRVQACGDAHLANFGGFASPERSLVFDINDFDQTLPGPWEWDVKRLTASIEISGRENGISKGQRRDMVRGAVKEYREAIRELAAMSTLDVWYAKVDADRIESVRSQLSQKQLERIERTLARAQRKDNARAFAKLATHVDGDVRILSQPPLIVPLRDLVSAEEAEQAEECMSSLLAAYARSLQGDRRRLVARFRFTDIARKVVGVGSVGTRCFVVLELGRDDQDPLFLQVKEAERSVLEPYVGKSKFANQGRRVVEGQRMTQAASDIMLGWLRAPGLDGIERDYYVRTMWDWKLSADVGTMRPDAMAAYAKLCGWTLAHGHARSGDAVMIGAYLGGGTKFDRAIASFAKTYADQNERDHTALLDAIATGRVRADSEI
jgi:uncharacterized protein (DUF2252 family)